MPVVEGQNRASRFAKSPGVGEEDRRVTEEVTSPQQDLAGFHDSPL